MSEQRMIRALSRLFATTEAGRAATLGIGDDAAVLRGARLRGEVVWTTDAAVEGVHFDTRYLSLSDVGARSFHAALSDIAAMGARPVAALSSLVVPRALGARAVRAITRGQAAAAEALGCPVVGGNLSHGGEISVTTTALGVTARPLRRDGAAVGEELWLMGDVGLAAAGFRWLASRRGRAGTRAEIAAVAACVAAWRRPEARVAAGRVLSRRATAAIDVSDGLSGDVAHLASASGVRIVIEVPRLARSLRPELLAAASLLRVSPLTLALTGGEDYALVATGEASRRPRHARRIGRVESGRGVVLEGADGRTSAARAGFDHFRA